MEIIGLPIRYKTLNSYMNGVISARTREGRYIIDIENGKQVTMSKYNAEKLTELALRN